MSINILDCTLRDGGYYNLWNFKLKDVQNYLNQISKSKIKTVEIGFKFLKKNSKYGKLAFVTEHYLAKLKIAKNINIAVMINGQDLINLGDSWQFALKNLFKKKKNNKIKIIRIAVHFDEIFKIESHIKFLATIGFKIFINLMQINKINKVMLKNFLLYIKRISSIKVFYFADSLGCLRTENVNRICRVIKKYWKKPFGFHAHDNCSFALSNSLEAVNSGANWVDATIQGMGRGAGNVKTESLVSELIHRNLNKKSYLDEPLQEIAQGYFLEMKKKYNWGHSIYYNIAANHNIHPTYIQELLSENRYTHQKVMKIISMLKKNPQAHSFNANFLNEQLSNKISSNYWNAKDFFKNKIILIIGQGPSVQINKNKILRFIKKKSCITFCLNINKFFNKKKYYNIISNEMRALIDQIEYEKLNNIIMPLSRLKKILEINVKKKIKNYGLIINTKRIKVKDDYAELPNTLAIGYALSICKASSAKKVYLAGFDGYDDKEEINLEMKLYLSKLIKYFKDLNLETLTRSKYKLPFSNELNHE